MKILYDLYARILLTSLAHTFRNYYYQKVSGVCATFDAMVYAVRTHFETEERRQRVTTEWEDTNLV